MNKEELLVTYKCLLVAFDLTPDDVVVDKSCMDVLADFADEAPKLSIMVHPVVHRIVVEIMEHENGNPSLFWGFLWRLDLHLMFDTPRTIAVGRVIGSAESFLSAPTTRTLH